MGYILTDPEDPYGVVFQTSWDVWDVDNFLNLEVLEPWDMGDIVELSGGAPTLYRCRKRTISVIYLMFGAQFLDFV